MEEIKLLKKHKRDILVIHYACSNLDISPVKISCIAVGDFNKKSVISFSRANKTEKELLKGFNEYLKKTTGKYFVVWNMSSPIYGFPALEQRYKDLDMVMNYIDETRVYDLDHIIKNKYGRKYASHEPSGQMYNLFEINDINTTKVIWGGEEAELFDKDFKKIDNSCSSKAKGIMNVLELLFNKKLKVQNDERNIIEKISESAEVKAVSLYLTVRSLLSLF